jgi:hypothetical protein
VSLPITTLFRSFGEAVNMVTFNAMNVLGATKINNADSDTSTTVLGSTLGSQVVNPLGGQMVVTNNLGFDSFSMGANTAGQNTTVPWGLYINNDAGAGGSSASGSQTTIAAASIGTLAGGLPGGNGLDPGVAFKVCDDQGSVNTLKVGADPGATGAQATAKAVTFGGGVVVRGSNGGDDDITIGSSTMAALTINTSSGSDTIRIDNSKISNSIAINTGSGEHDHVIISNTNYATQWPNPMLGTITIADGGGGSDELTQTSDVGAIPTAPTGFEVFD